MRAVGRVSKNILSALWWCVWVFFYVAFVVSFPMVSLPIWFLGGERIKDIAHKGNVILSKIMGGYVLFLLLIGLSRSVIGTLRNWAAVVANSPGVGWAIVAFIAIAAIVLAVVGLYALGRRQRAGAIALPARNSGGCVYFILDPSINRIKIGYCTLAFLAECSEKSKRN